MALQRRPSRGLSPFHRLFELPDEIGRWWDRDWWPWPTLRVATRDGGWSPTIDVFQDGSDLVVKAELPGVKREDVEVTLEEGDLVLKGERKEEKEVKEEHYYRMERSFGSFYRRVPLTGEVKPDAVHASFKDGVLEVRVPQPQPAAAKASEKVTIQ